MSFVMTALCALLWMLAGAGVASFIWAWRGGALHPRHDELWRYRSWLGRRCHVKRGDGWVKCEAVAVSHEGAIAARPLAGGEMFWVEGDEVRERVVWL